jgi:hypothetical protein
LRENVDRLEEEITKDIAELYQKPIDEWDWEELSRGRPRGADGKFQGDKPKWITPAVQAEARRRMRTLTEDELMTHAMDAIKVLKGLMSDDGIDDFGKPTTPGSVKLQAAQYVLNHVIGTPKARVEIESGNPLAELMGGVLVNPDGEPSHIIVEGSVVEDDDDEEE